MPSDPTQTTNRRVHKPSLGPYSFDHPKTCLNCGKWLNGVPIDEPCDAPEQRTVEQHLKIALREIAEFQPDALSKDDPYEQIAIFAKRRARKALQE